MKTMKAMKKKAKKTEAPKSHPKRLNGLARVILVYAGSIILILATLYGVFSVMFAGKIYPRVSVAGIMVGGLTPAAAEQKLTEELAKRHLRPVIVSDNDGRSFTLKPEEANITHDVKQSVASAMAIGRTGRWLATLAQKITTPILGYELPSQLRHDEQKIIVFVDDIAKEVNQAEKNADLNIKNGVVSIIPATVGQEIDTKLLKKQVLEAFGNSQAEPITLKIKQKEPAIKDELAENAKKVAEALLSVPIIYHHNDQKYEATAAIMGGWLQTKPIDGLLGSRLEVTLNEKAIDKYIAELAGKINIEARNARLSMNAGALNIIESSKAGLKMKQEAAKTETIRLLTLRQEVPANELVTTVPATPVPATASPTSPTSPEAPAPSLITLVVETIEPEITDAKVASLGIKERVAISTSEFKGSPNNRQDNIRLGTKLYHGVILAPGQQFSAVKALGDIDESAGFKKELVIKQDQLIAEVGGGLCQVSTTLFRAVMNAGLKIDERRNHRFRVSYYEQRPSQVDPEDYVTLAAKTLVGIDATIYDPSPDFKFTNDTANYLLIQGRIEDTRVIFEIFGTKDGRKTMIEGPFITSTTPAPKEIQYIDDPTLPAGQTKLKEKAVGGTKTYFVYKVEKDGKIIHNNTYGSNYVPWQAKYYRGTGPAAAPSPAPTASPTETPTATPEPAPAQPAPAEPAPSPTPAA